MDIIEVPRTYCIASLGKLHFRQWDNDGLVFVEGPDDTHLVNLPTIHLLEFLVLHSGSSEVDMKEFLITKLALEFNETEFRRMLTKLLNIRLVESIENNIPSLMPSSQSRL